MPVASWIGCVGEAGRARRFSRAEQTRRALAMKTEDHYSPLELEIAHLLGQGVPEPFDPAHSGGEGGHMGGMGGQG